MKADLEARFAIARATGDEAALARLFAEAADRVSHPQARAFMLTQAYALGLGAGLPECGRWRDELVALGAERPALVQGG